MICKNCGRPLEPNVQFCGFCGTQVEEQVKNKPFEEKKNKKLNNSTKIALLMMLLAFCILGVSVFIFVSRTQKTTLKTNETTQKTVSNQSATANLQVTYNSNIGETLQIAIPDNIIATKPQANTDDNKTNYDKYGKYIGKDFSYVLNDYPNAEKQTDEFWGRDIIKLTDSVTLYYDYDGDKIEYYACAATDLFSNINSAKQGMTRTEFEDYLGVSTHFYAGEHHSDALSTLNYYHQGYYIYIFCDFDGSITLDDVTFNIKKPQENDSQNNNSFDKTYYDRYGIYLREPFELAFKDYPLQDAVKVDESGSKIFHYNDVTLYYYATDICYKYDCFAYELYPGLVYDKSSVSKEEFEDYLGVEISFENSSGSNPFLYYWHDDYYFEVTCESNGTINFGESVFSVIHKEDTPR